MSSVHHVLQVKGVLDFGLPLSQPRLSRCTNIQTKYYIDIACNMTAVISFFGKMMACWLYASAVYHDVLHDEVMWATSLPRG